MIGVRVRAAAAAALALGFGSASANAAAFVNGGFESPGGAPIRHVLGEGDTFVTGWTNSGGFQIYESNGQDGIDAGEGDYYVSFGHSGATGGTLSQTFSTTAGTAYTLNYLVRQQQGFDDAGTGLRISVSTGASVQVLSPSGSAWAAGAPLRFTGTGDDVTLTIADITTTGGSSSNLAIDGLELSASGTPEPVSWAMMIVGFGGVGGILRRRRNGGGQPGLA